MQYIKDLIGQKFNYLTAIKWVGKDNRGKSLWLFKCDCGNEKVIRGTNVTSGHIKSCGCKCRAMNFKSSEKQREYTTKLHGNKLRSKIDLYKNNQSGVTGVHRRKDGRFACSICINGKHYQTTKKNFYDAVSWRESKLKGVKIMLLKNVLKGLKKEYDIKQLTIIKGYKVQFSGTLETFDKIDDIDMFEFKKKLLNSEVVARDSIANTKHFIFIK